MTYTKQSFAEARQNLRPEAFVLLNHVFLQGYYADGDDAPIPRISLTGGGWQRHGTAQYSRVASVLWDVRKSVPPRHAGACPFVDTV